jgi:hypothetical protein
MQGNSDKYKIKEALRECLKFYNTKFHGTIKCAPEEAFL